MSIKLTPGAARLTVLGSGWSSSSVESGDGLTEDGKLWEDIAGDLGYDFGDDVDWDQIAGGSINWSDIIYTDIDGNIFTEDEAVLKDDELDMWVPKDTVLDISNGLEVVSAKDSLLMKYAIDPPVIRSLYGGKVSREGTIIVDEGETDIPQRPHMYKPSVYYIQKDATTAILFLDEPFYHYTADGGNLTVSSESISIRDGSVKRVFWSSCTTFFTGNVLPEPYSGYPIQYVCWQCLHGSFANVLVAANENTITTGMIQAGTAVYETMTIDGKTYYKLMR